MLRHALRSAIPARRAAAIVTAKRCFASYPPHELVGLPALSPTMESGNLAKWRMKEGDRITAGDIICEIETDKAVVDYEATDDMWLAKILVAEGTENIAVGQPMMVVCEEEEYLAGLADYKVEASATVATPAPAAGSPEPTKKEEAAPTVKEPVATPPTTQQKTAASPAVPELVKMTAPTPTPASAVVFAEKWGQGIKKSAISLSLLKKQQAYIDVYGLTGTTPVGPDSK